MKKYNPHELRKNSDIRLTARAVRQRWKKTTVSHGMLMAVSFAKEEWQGWVRDVPDESMDFVEQQIAAGNKFTVRRLDGCVIHFVPPCE